LGAFKWKLNCVFLHDYSYFKWPHTNQLFQLLRNGTKFPLSWINQVYTELQMRQIVIFLILKILYLLSLHIIPASRCSVTEVA
jgi:hypothetical protein